MGVRRVLFVALGEAEVPAYEWLARTLRRDGVQSRVVTWLPRLASEQTGSLEMTVPPQLLGDEDLTTVLADHGIADISMAADYDRDWHFASRPSKTTHVRRVASALSAVFDEFQPDLMVSSVGGETTRIVAEAISAGRRTPTAFFNAVPLPGRFVMMRSLAAPFVPYPEVDSSYRPVTAAVADESDAGLGQAPQKQSVADGFRRAYARVVQGERTYPASWLARRTSDYAKARILTALPRDELPFDPSHRVKILFPLHDERDFQVAVRERHAIPQSALLKYLSTTLPPGFHLYVKPHPEHLASHHSVLWRELRDQPNVHFLPAGMKAAEAMAAADVVFTLASSLGFEAINAGMPVVCYGRPFYGGRGATIDVSDPRDLASALQAAVHFTPDQQDVDALTGLVETWSWPGRFTPLVVEDDNLAKLLVGLRDVMGSV